MDEIKKILVANRGEIALRVIRTCREMGIDTVAVYSEADSEAPHTLAAGQSVNIGKAASSESYLAVDKIIDAARQTAADAIHPGYGFLSENPRFARACADEGLIFIGPSPESIELMGNKTAARELIGSAGVPYPPGTVNALEDLEQARQVAKKIGYPVLVKAAAGGGGKGMRVIENGNGFEAGIRAAKSEAKNAFGDDRVYIEKYLEAPRHVEFQIIADQYGQICHLFERECSIQRRHQKVIEEAPCALLTPELRQEMAGAAIEAAKACNYIGAGTIEFLVDRQKKFYFLEMNTRLQVEHPVTELITGLDLVELQIRIARGEKLPFRQEEVKMSGHAIECRIYAEDPGANFLPDPGRLVRHRPAAGPGVRVDAGVEEGQLITTDYDPMISKMCTHAKDRESAISRMERALSEYEIAGCRTTIPFCSYVMRHPDFKRGEYDTRFVTGKFDPGKLSQITDSNREAISIAASLIREETGNNASVSNGINRQPSSSPAAGYTNWWNRRR